jgi:histone deacetylase 6
MDEELKAYEQRLAEQRRRFSRVSASLRKVEEARAAREVLAGGLHLIDFEQLKIENQTHNEKIEERNEALIRLKRRVRSAVQVLTHVKEKLYFMEEEHRRLTAQRERLDGALAQRRQELTYARRARDKLSDGTRKLRQVRIRRKRSGGLCM